ncbi:MAG: hypothetical protein DRH89_00580 [Candidatus Cloacimonadota bacterium]|nr:MAG: hypothetical protein DRH89_00580 [Candidatus Cloacimonadota bacterium]
MKKVMYFILLCTLVILESCGKKEVKKAEVIVQKPEPVKVEVVKAEEPVKIKQPVVIEKEDFQLQLVASTDIYEVEATQEVLSRHGFKTIKTIRHKDGELFHRLRITGFLTYTKAYDMGEKIKNELHLIANYWIEKVKI